MERELTIPQDDWLAEMLTELTTKLEHDQWRTVDDEDGRSLTTPRINDNHRGCRRARIKRMEKLATPKPRN